MSDLEWHGQPTHASLRRALRHGLRGHSPGLRVIAEEFLAESSSIDLLAVGSGGEIVSIRIGSESEEALLFTRGLADLTWLRPRVADLVKLAPTLGLEASAEPRAMILCPRFTSETRAAAANVPARTFELLEYRCLRQQGQLVLLFEPRVPAQQGPLRPSQDAEATESDRPPPRSRTGVNRGMTTLPMGDVAGPSRRPAPAPRSPTFRTGLSEADIRREPVGERANG